MTPLVHARANKTHTGVTLTVWPGEGQRRHRRSTLTPHPATQRPFRRSGKTRLPPPCGYTTAGLTAIHFTQPIVRRSSKTPLSKSNVDKLLLKTLQLGNTQSLTQALTARCAENDALTGTRRVTATPTLAASAKHSRWRPTVSAACYRRGLNESGRDSFSQTKK